MACAASTEPSGRPNINSTAPMLIDLTQAWALSSGVAVRHEAFGALAYDYRSRRLSCLTDQALADLLPALGRYPSAQAALDATVPITRHPSFARALTGLAASGVICVDEP